MRSFDWSGREDLNLSDDCAMVYVRQQVEANKIVACLKTDAAWRDVDLDPRVAHLLREYVKDHNRLAVPVTIGLSAVVLELVQPLSAS